LPLKKGTVSKTGKRIGPPIKFTLDLQREFCALYARGGTVPMAAKKCGVTSVTIYEHARTDENFKAMYEAATELNTDDLESLLHQMARAGNITALFGTLKARRPERWRDNFKIEHGGSLILTSADQLEQARSRNTARDLPAFEARH